MRLLSWCKLKAFQLTGKSKALIADIEEPKTENPDCTTVSMKALSICGTDAKIYSGGILTKKLPIIMGHEGGGVVDRIGDIVQEGLTEKSKVLIDPNIFDGTCGLCKAGLPNLCENGGLMGRDDDGIFAERIALHSEHLYPIPSSIKDEIVPLIQPLSTVVRAMGAIRIEPDDDVIIIGLGVTGLLFSRAVQTEGC